MTQPENRPEQRYSRYQGKAVERPLAAGEALHRVVAVLLMIGICVATAWIYAPGLSGPFLLDDFHNLRRLGALGPIESWELLRAYLTSGGSGPTGRPISLASFLIDARDWPADPAAFKRTNLIIHCLIGFFLFLTIRSLLHAIGRTPKEIAWIALLATALWLLNPFLVSTTLYVVQRMTQLATLFVVLGFWGYLLGRSWLIARPRLAYLAMSLSVVMGTLLALFSKENGALLPLLILVAEFALRHHWSAQGPDWRWRAVFLWIPSLLVLAYLSMRLPGMDQTIPARGWSVLERLMTQPRIVWDYLFHLLVPKIQTLGLYRDDIVPSQGLLIPPSTLFAILGLAGLLVGAILARRRIPLLSLAILFFLAAHLLESTVVPLELYYEHRNYLPALLLFLPVAAGVVALKRRFSPVIAPIVVLALVGSFAVATYQRATLWGDEELLHTVWATNNPHSARAQISYFQVLTAKGEYAFGMAYLRAATEDMPDSSILTGVYLANRAAAGSLSAEEFRETAARMRGQPFDRQQPQALRLLVNGLNAHAPSPEHTEIMMAFLDGWRDDWGSIRVVREQSYYLQGMLLSGQGQPARALEHFLQALERVNTVEGGLNMASTLAGNGHLDEAIAVLEATRLVLADLPDRSLRQRRATLSMEIERLEGLIREDIEPS